ncbi:MAG: FliH/SctL family protein [Bacillota bacterium]|nr:FliH/SctL family protein [Bacillota bacterium]
MSSKVIKAANLVLGATPVTIATSWSIAGWEEGTPASELAREEEERWAASGESEPAGLAVERESEEMDPEVQARVALARERANAIVTEAEAEAERLLDEARTRAARLLEEARHEGYQAGFREGEERGLAEGRAKAEAEMEAAVKQAMKVLTAAVHEKARLVASSREDVLKIVRRVAEKIIRAEVRLDPAVVERAIDASLRLVTERSQVLVRVSPEDLARAREGVPHFLKYFTPSAVVEVCADPRLTPGGCLIETNGGNIDAQLETQLEEALGKLEERLYGG